MSKSYKDVPQRKLHPLKVNMELCQGLTGKSSAYLGVEPESLLTDMNKEFYFNQVIKMN
ncbi:hypothetical protein [Nostoc sp.]|uniref:hypothetical protein n=1 Tax=Nostoc sp. TaxID=1180 RepID=UPI002FF5EE56